MICFTAVAADGSSVARIVHSSGTTDYYATVAEEGYSYAAGSVLTATEPGDYTATAVLDNGCLWADGSADPAVLEWSVAVPEYEILEGDGTPLALLWGGLLIALAGRSCSARAEENNRTG